MIAHKKEFTGGLVLHIAFWIVFVLLLSPLYPGQGKKVNMLDYMDSMYNSISKKSAYYVPATQKKVEVFKGNNISLNIKADAKLSMERMTALMQHADRVIHIRDGMVEKVEKIHREAM